METSAHESLAYETTPAVVPQMQPKASDHVMFHCFVVVGKVGCLFELGSGVSLEGLVKNIERFLGGESVSNELGMQCPEAVIADVRNYLLGLNLTQDHDISRKYEPVSIIGSVGYQSFEDRYLKQGSCRGY